MKTILIILGVIIILGLGWLLFFDSSNGYEVFVDQELTALEEELAAIEGQAAAGTLTEQQAAAAQVRISQRLDSVSASLPTDESLDLNEQQRSELRDGLARLKDIIVQYQDTLLVIDQTANDQNGRSVVNKAIETVEDVQSNLEVVADGLPLENVDVFLEEVSATTEAAMDIDLQVDATTSTTTTATTTDLEDTEATTTPEEDKGPIINPDLEATTSVEAAT